MRRIALCVFAFILASCATASAQNPTCFTASAGDTTNKCASTEFVQKVISSGSGVPQLANSIFSGPTSGGAAAPTFRAMVNADLPTPIVSPGSITLNNTTTNAFAIDIENPANRAWRLTTNSQSISWFSSADSFASPIISMLSNTTSGFVGIGAAATSSATFGVTAITGSAGITSTGGVFFNGGNLPYTNASGTFTLATNQGPLMLEGGGPQATWHETDETGYETGTAQAGSATTITLRAGASAINNFTEYVAATVTITGGTGSGQVRLIASYVGATKIATISGSNFSPAPDNTSTYKIGRCDYGWNRQVADQNFFFLELWESSAPLTCADGPFGQQDEWLRFNRWIHQSSMNYPLTGNGNRAWWLSANYVWDGEAAQTPQQFQIFSLSAATNTQVEALRLTPNNATPYWTTPASIQVALGYGASAPVAVGGSISTGVNSELQIAGSGSASSMSMLRFTSPGGGGSLVELGASRGASIGTFAAVQTGDGLGSFQFWGDNGTNYTGTAAQITAVARGTFTTSSEPASLVFSTTTSGATSSTQRLELDPNGSAIFGSAAIATNATDGFLYAVSGAGAPTGVPTTYTGRVPVYIDTTNSQLWLYLGGAWKQPKTPAGAALVTWQ